MVHVIGIDGGGTSCRAAVADLEGRILGMGRAGPANVMTDIHQARNNIIEAGHRACMAASIEPTAISGMPAFLGLAGAGVGDRAEVIARILPFARSVVKTDALIALEGALGEEDGAVAIIGTGSVFAARTSGTVRKIGGWGFRLGDLGSGARLGRALLQEVLLVHDGMRRSTPLIEEVFGCFKDDPLALVEFAHAAQPSAFASFAPAVFEYADRGDPIGIALVQGASRSVEEALRAILPPHCDRLCMLGGLGPLYARRLSKSFQRRLREPLGDALDGAVRLAMQLCRGQAGSGMQAKRGRMTPQASSMRLEIEEIPNAVADLLQRGGSSLERAGLRLRENNPALVATVARGSSDHAAAYLKYAFELSAGAPVASLAPSIASIFGARLKLGRAACLAISQSGRSPDIVEMARSAGEGGALTLALTNSPDSPLADICDEVIDIMAGPEKSVAATKTFVNSVVAGLALLAHWTADAGLNRALIDLPMHLSKAIGHDWTQLGDKIEGGTSLFILGRGPSLAVAQEAALKFKETCGIHAEAYSSAEFMHGPVSLIGDGFPVLVLAARDAAEATNAESADQLAGKGAAVFATSSKISAAAPLPFTETGHPLTDPLVLIASFYSFVETFARMRGLDPDQPMHLHKITETR